MEVFKAILWTIIIIAILIAGSVLGVIIVPFAIVAIIYIIIRAIQSDLDGYE